MEGFGLLMKIKTSDFNEVLKEKYKLFIANEISKKVINECSIDLQSINKHTFIEDKIPLIKNKLGMDEKDLLKFKTAIWEQEGILDFDEILYFSYLLIKEFKFIAYYLRYTFPYILIDEYQDTNPIQNKIIELISNNKMV
jgi:DNA helicase-2/ATP-dependent DNA helicase PcrA